MFYRMEDLNAEDLEDMEIEEYFEEQIQKEEA